MNNNRKLYMAKSKKIQMFKVIGYVLVFIYIFAFFILLLSMANLDMIPIKYIAIIGIVFSIFASLFAWMHERKFLSVIASLLSIVMIVTCGFGTYFIHKTNKTITKVATVSDQKDVISLYVMNEDPAQSLSDIADYQIGIVTSQDRDNTDKAVNYFEEQLGSKLHTVECDTMFMMMNDLKEGNVQAVVLNGAYASIISDVEGFEWVATDIRIIASAEIEIEEEIIEEVPEKESDTFVMYLSGIDTYGGVSARSRSDVNILAVVNTKTKEVLLLSTPRDAYLSFSKTGGAKDKLTHAGIYGVNASIDALEQLYDVEVDYYLRLNFTGFIDIIDALGGITVYSEHDFTVEPVKTYHKGYNDLTGIEALAFARERYSFQDGDYQRAKNQMEVIRALIQKCASSSMLANYVSVMDAVSGSFETSMPDEQIAALVRMQLSDMAQWNISSYTTSGTSTHAETFSMPGRDLYVINLSPEAVNKAKQLIQGIYGTENEE